MGTEDTASEIRIHFQFFDESMTQPVRNLVTPHFIRVMYEDTGGGRCDLLVSVKKDPGLGVIPGGWSIQMASSSALLVKQNKILAGTWQECLDIIADTLASDARTRPLGDALEVALEKYWPGDDED